MISDRESFLRVIDANPNERHPKLVYADWLEEFGESESDAATVEFIRLTNHEMHLSKTGRVRRHAFAWLKDNWSRLVATAHAKYRNRTSRVGLYHAAKERGYAGTLVDFSQEDSRQDEFAVHRWRSSRTLVTHWNLFPTPDADRTYSYRCVIEFGNGFVESFEARNSVASEQLYRLVLLDQPFAKFGSQPTDVLSVTCPDCGTTHHLSAWPTSHAFWVCNPWPNRMNGMKACGRYFDRVRQNVYEPRQPGETTRLNEAGAVTS
jgi:uncharacterized protein (TIGR02996 family)